MRLDVYQAKIAAQKNIKESGQWDKLDPESQRLVEKMVSLMTRLAENPANRGIIGSGWNACWSGTPSGQTGKVDGLEEGALSNLP